MATIRIAFDDADVQRGLAEMLGRGTAMHSVFKNLRPELRDELKRSAARESSPEGAWAPRAHSTMERLEKRGAIKMIKRRERRKRKGGEAFAGPLRETVTKSLLSNTLGRLPGGVVTKASATSLVAESPAAWSAIHNVGGRAGHGSLIPARPFVFFSGEFLKQAERDIEQFVLNAWEGR